MFKNMAGGASMNQMAQMGKQSAMKERLRKKMEEKKMREALALATATQATSSQVVTQATAPALAPKTYVVCERRGLDS